MSNDPLLECSYIHTLYLYTNLRAEQRLYKRTNMDAYIHMYQQIYKYCRYVCFPATLPWLYICHTARDYRRQHHCPSAIIIRKSTIASQCVTNQPKLELLEKLADSSFNDETKPWNGILLGQEVLVHNIIFCICVSGYLPTRSDTCHRMSGWVDEWTCGRTDVGRLDGAYNFLWIRLSL